MHHQGRDRDGLEVVGEVGLRKGLDTVVLRLDAAHHALTPPIASYPFDDRRARAVVTIEGQRDVDVELGAVETRAHTDLVEHVDRQAPGVLLAPHHDWRNGTDQRGLGDAFCAVPGDIAGNLAATRRMTDVDRIPQVQRRGEFRDVCRVGVHLVARRCLGRAAMPAPVMGDHPVAALEKKHHLGIPVVRAQRPTVMKHDGLAAAPILVEDLGAVLDGDGSHCMDSFDIAYSKLASRSAPKPKGWAANGRLDCASAADDRRCSGCGCCQKCCVCISDLLISNPAWRKPRSIWFIQRKINTDSNLKCSRLFVAYLGINQCGGPHAHRQLDSRHLIQRADKASHILRTPFKERRAPCAMPSNPPRPASYGPAGGADRPDGASAWP